MKDIARKTILSRSSTPLPWGIPVQLVQLLAWHREISLRGSALKKMFAKERRMVDGSIRVINRIKSP